MDICNKTAKRKCCVIKLNQKILTVQREKNRNFEKAITDMDDRSRSLTAMWHNSKRKEHKERGGC